MLRAAMGISAAALAAAALTACGQASAPPPKPPAEEAPHASRYDYGRLSRSQAAAFADAVNIRSADVPGFVVAADTAPQTTGEQRLERALLTCAGIMNGHGELAQSGSKEFERTERTDALGVSTSVSVARTPAIAASGLTAAQSPNARTCLVKSLARDVERTPRGGSNIRSLSAAPEKALAPGTNGGVVLRVLADVKLGGKNVPLSLDFYGFVCGQAEIGLFTTSLPGTFPVAVRRQLLQLLLERARAQGQCPAQGAGSAAL